MKSLCSRFVVHKGGILTTNRVEGKFGVAQIPERGKQKPKWAGLAEKVFTVQPRRTLTVEFANETTANEASDYICNELNKRLGVPVFQKQLVVKRSGQTTVYFSRLGHAKVTKVE
jgi:hypothetical protein